ncbi:MAG: hypothetical protein K2X27_14270 [Candidatus Obscuribacterales bacterium]|nr:hypothetical protein [Candidatus Obscuribacterales bacterium]
MLKTQTPRYQTAQPRQTEAQKYLWDDFVQQVASYARRQTVTHKGKPFSERIGSNSSADKAWYNKINAR